MGVSNTQFEVGQLRAFKGTQGKRADQLQEAQMDDFHLPEKSVTKANLPVEEICIRGWHL